MLIEIRLETRDGHFVATEHILPFQLLPEVILWGERTFIAYNPPRVSPYSGPPVYREGLLFAIPKPCYWSQQAQPAPAPPADPGELPAGAR